MAQKSKKKGKDNKNQNSTRFPIVRGNVDYFIVVVTLILLCLGLIMLLSASAPTSISESGNSYSYFKRQIMAASAGLAFMFILSFINYKYYRKFKYFIYVFTIILLFLVEIMGMGSGGAKRWINLFGFNFQPSEVAKPSLIIFFAAHLVDLKEKGNISTWEAITLYGETRLSSVIYNLREQGWKIQTLQEQSFDNEGESVRYGRYILE